MNANSKVDSGKLISDSGKMISEGGEMSFLYWNVERLEVIKRPRLSEGRIYDKGKESNTASETNINRQKISEEFRFC